MTIVDVVKRMFKQKAKTESLTENQLRWNYVGNEGLREKQENEITQVLEQYANEPSQRLYKYFMTEQERKQERSGTLYHEFYKGKWDEKTFWKEDSLLLRDDILHRTELVNILGGLICNYNYYGETEIDQEQWKIICKIASDTGGELEEVILELKPWVEENFKEHTVFTILGI